jgi:hypothetical protein
MTLVVDAFIAAKIKIDAIIEELTALSEDHFDVNPEAINWGHVGTINAVLSGLRRIAKRVGIYDEDA